MDGHVDTAVIETGEPVPGARPEELSWRRLARTALLGCLATLSIVMGALLGGSSYETHLAGAWFFGMPGGPLGSIGSNNPHPPIGAIAAVYGGMILLTRVWIGLLRQLSAHRGVPV